MPFEYTGTQGIPAYPDVDQMFRSRLAGDQMLAERRAEAIRWQGSQEYDTLVKSGVSPQDAFSRTATKLFYNEPRAMASVASDINMGGGEIFTDPGSGRQFIRQPNGKIAAVPQRWMGSTTVMDPNGQVYKLPLDAGGLANAPRVTSPPPAPQVVTLPGSGGQMIVQPSGSGTRIPTPATDIVTIYDKDTGRTRHLTTQQDALEQATAAAKPLLDQYNAHKNEVAAGQWKFGPDWGLNPAEPYTNRMARIQGQLKDLGLDTEGKPLPGSKLAMGIAGPSGQTPGAAVAPPSAPMVTGNRRQKPNVPLGPGETLVETAQYGWVVYDNNRKRFVRYADESPTN